MHGGGGTASDIDWATLVSIKGEQVQSGMPPADMDSHRLPLDANKTSYKDGMLKRYMHTLGSRPKTAFAARAASGDRASAF